MEGAWRTPWTLLVLHPFACRHCPFHHTAREALVHPVVVLRLLLVRSNHDAGMPGSWASLPAPSHWHGVPLLCVAEPHCRG